MKTHISLTLGIILLVLCGCSASKKAISPEQKAEIMEILGNKQYRIDFNTAYPQNTLATQQVVNQIMIPTGNSAARIDIAGNGDFLSIENDMGTANLPFFGERRLGSSYNTTDVGINFNDQISDYQIIDNSTSIQVGFKVRGEDDSYEVTLTVFGNKQVSAFVISSDKTNMKYDGTLRAIATDEMP